MNAEEIRAEIIAVAAQEIASWESDPTPNSRHFACAEGIANALEKAGMLPTEDRWAVIGAMSNGDDWIDCGSDDNPYTREDAEQQRNRHYRNDGRLVVKYSTDWNEAEK